MRVARVIPYLYHCDPVTDVAAPCVAYAVRQHRAVGASAVRVAEDAVVYASYAVDGIAGLDIVFIVGGRSGRSGGEGGHFNGGRENGCDAAEQDNCQNQEARESFRGCVGFGFCGFDRATLLLNKYGLVCFIYDRG